MIDKFGSTSGELNFEQVHLQPQPASSSKLQHSPSFFLTLSLPCFHACDQFCKLMRTALLVDEVRLKMRKGGSREKVIESGEVMNVRDVETDPRIEDEVISDARRRHRYRCSCKSFRRTIHILFRSLSLVLLALQSRRRYKMRGYDVKSLLLAPIFNDDGQVIGLVELVNKECEDEGPPAEGVRRSPSKGAVGAPLMRRNSEYGFNQDDERLLRMLCAHCSIFLKHLET